MNTTPQQLHIPVLLDAVIGVLKPQKGERYLDLTAGYGGHAQAVIEKIGAASLATLVDRDKTAVAAIDSLGKMGARIIHGDYAAAAETLHRAGEQFDLILLDLGVSSPQLDVAERGFSFMADGPLDMRMDQSQGVAAAEWLNGASRNEIMQILREYGEEPFAPRIADAIVAARPLHTTAELAQIVEKAYRGRRGKTHPATRTFMAIRIAVNNELRQLRRALDVAVELLRPGGRIAIISFHSLEDRMVKQFFKEQATAGYEATLTILTKQPVSGATEDVNNPRARSAKLRAAAKINNKKG